MSWPCYWGGENESRDHCSAFASRLLYGTQSKGRRLPAVAPILLGL